MVPESTASISSPQVMGIDALVQQPLMAVMPGMTSQRCVLGEALMQMRVGAVEEGIAGADHGDILAGVELGGERRGARVVEGDKRVAITRVGLRQLGGEGIIEADELGVRIELAVDDAARIADASLLGEIGDDRRSSSGCARPSATSAPGRPGRRRRRKSVPRALITLPRWPAH